MSTSINLYDVSGSAETLWGNTSDGVKVLISGTLLFSSASPTFNGNVTQGPPEIRKFNCTAHITDTQAKLVLKPPKITGAFADLFNNP